MPDAVYLPGKVCDLVYRLNLLKDKAVTGQDGQLQLCCNIRRLYHICKLSSKTATRLRWYLQHPQCMPHDHDAFVMRSHEALRVRVRNLDAQD